MPRLVLDSATDDDRARTAEALVRQAALLLRDASEWAAKESEDEPADPAAGYTIRELEEITWGAYTPFAIDFERLFQTVAVLRDAARLLRRMERVPEPAFRPKPSGERRAAKPSGATADRSAAGRKGCHPQGRSAAEERAALDGPEPGGTLSCPPTGPEAAAQRHHKPALTGYELRGWRVERSG